MNAYIFDVIIVLILVFFAWRGAKNGLIFTLCGLLGLVVAFFGAQFISSQFYQPVAQIVQPAVYQTILGAEPEQAQEEGQQPSDGTVPEDPEAALNYTLEQLLQAMKDQGLFAGFAYYLDEAGQLNSIPSEGGQTVAKALSDHMSKVVARAGLFALSFLLILMVWFLLSHILDLAFQLPMLSAVNTVGGAAVGLIKAVLIVFVLVWLGQLANVVPSNPTTPVLSLFTFKGLGSLLNQILI